MCRGLCGCGQFTAPHWPRVTRLSESGKIKNYVKTKYTEGVKPFRGRPFEGAVPSGCEDTVGTVGGT